jgi:hypothetical protein
MDRNQGTTLGAVLIAALLFRTGMQPSPKSTSEDQPASATASVTQVVGEGPWTASCRYWAPERKYVPSDPGVEEISTADVQPTKAPFPSYHVSFKDPSTLWKCGKDINIWGIPTDMPKPSGDVIIAIVPDPVITSMPLKFDRAIDALTNAAAHRKQRYQSSFYWLPWQPTSSRNQRDNGPASWEKKSQEPGLIILRKLNQSSDAPSDPDAFKGTDILYVFLVGETPTSGIDGDQMQRALSYRTDLQKSFFTSNSISPEVLRIIGPNFSGSAPSLAEALATAATTTTTTCATIRGTTSTVFAADYLDKAQGKFCPTDKSPLIGFLSFSDDNAYSRKAFISALVQSGISPNQIALLVEQGTTFGAASDPTERIKHSSGQHSGSPQGSNNDCTPNGVDCYNVIQFPRDIFMLRNAYEQRNAKPQDAIPSPYLQLKLNGTTPTDDIPNFDTQMTPLSQEAQLMAIQHQLLRYHTKYILLWGSSNILDQIFLAQYFRRALPDARIVFNTSDLLIERETDNTKLIGSLTVTPYHLIGLGNPENPGFGGFAFPDTDSDSYYNATTSILCAMTDDCRAEDFAAYKPPLGPPISKGKTVRPPFWVTAAGADGYYPLGILTLTGNSEPKADARFLPGIPLGQEVNSSRFPLHPSSLWFLLCAVITLVSILHAVALSVANYWSPFTRWVAISQNDDPERLSLFINIGTAALFSMACVTSIPLFACSFTLIGRHGWSLLAASITLLSGFAALVCTARKTGKITWTLLRSKESHSIESDRYFYRWFQRLALAACLLIPGTWLLCCSNLPTTNQLTLVGSCFAFRCLYPQSGVSPLLPTLIVLAAWHLWAVIHSLRHRFSPACRPLMPSGQRCDSEITSYQLYVTDLDLTVDHPIASRLVSNITSLLITRELFMRFATDCQSPDCHANTRKQWHRLLVTVYFLSFVAAVFLPVIHTLDSMMWTIGGIHANAWPSYWLWRFKFTPFELINRTLFFPILVIALTSWLRMMVVWGSLKRGVLQTLEQSPLRFAFDSIKGTLRLSLFKQSGMREQWNDMARSTESIRQFLNDENCKCFIAGSPQEQDLRYRRMRNHYDDLNQSIVDVIDHLKNIRKNPALNENSYMLQIEKGYQELSTEVLSYILVPYWWNRKHGLVESTGERPDIPESESKSAAMTLSAGRLLDAKGQKVITLEPLTPVGFRSCGQVCIEAAEEFIAIRYLALIRAVLVNLRYTMIFVTLSFVLAITAWNSYPFQPKQLVNWIFTLVLILLGSGIVMVLVQMYHDPLLSRIANKKPNELGWDFFVKVASLIGLPLLSWLAYNYPEIGDTLFKIFQPGTGVVK